MEPLKDNAIKGENYKELIEKHGLATKHGFYLEGATIAYSLIEDRLSEALMSLGLAYLSKEGKLRWASCLNELKGRYFLCSYERKTKLPRLDSLAAKLDLLRACVNFSKGDKPVFEKGLGQKCEDLVSSVCKACKRMRLDDAFFARAERWRTGRNHLVHALVNFKSPQAIQDEAKFASSEGFEIFRIIDRQICGKAKGKGVSKRSGQRE